MNYFLIIVLIFSVHLHSFVLSKSVVGTSRKVELDVKSVERDAETGAYRVHLASDDKNHQLHLQKLEQDDLFHHNAMSVIQADVDAEGKLVFDRWVPTADELKSVNNIYVDANSRAALTIHENDGEHILNGVVDGISIQHDGEQHIAHIPKTPKNDMLQVPLPEVQNSSNSAEPAPMADNTENIVELLIFCDFEWGDLLGQNRQKMLEYWTIFMWDVNMRYKTLESVKVSFKTVGVVVAANRGAQSFIEEARQNGKVTHNRLLNTWPKFAQNNAGSLPKFDLVAIATATAHEWYGGLAYVGAVCNYPTYNIASFNEDGRWSTVSVAAHEMGHSMGASHDDDPNASCKGDNYDGYIMDGSDEDRRFFFSPCSDRVITQTVNSNDRACLRRQDEPNRLDLVADYDRPLAPDFNAQCKVQARDNRAAYQRSSGNQCKKVTCKNANGGTFDIQPLDNSICDNNARCYRGNCRQNGNVFKNVATGLCLRAQNAFSYSSPFEMFKCPKYASPLDRLVVRNGNTGTTMAAPFEQGKKTKETGDKCMYTGISDDDLILTWSDRCGDYSNPWHGWEFRDVGNGQFTMFHKVTKRCARPENRNEGARLAAHKVCDNNNPEMRWTRA